MKADITRNTFRKEKNYRRVIKQQGKVDVDADPNEFQDIEIHHERTSLRDVIGKSGAPIENAGFAIIPAASIEPGASNYKIGKGRYYVDGILVENHDVVGALNQPDLPNPPPPNRTSVTYPGGIRVYSHPEDPGIYLAYLHVWERHITALDDPYIQESALGGPDTSTRSQDVWQVQLLRLDKIPTSAISAKIRLGTRIIEDPDGNRLVPILIRVEDDDDGLQRKIRSFIAANETSGRIEVEDPDANWDIFDKDIIELNVNVQADNGTSITSAKIRLSEIDIDANKNIFDAQIRIGQEVTTAGKARIIIQDKDGDKDLGEIPFGATIVSTYEYESIDDLSEFNCTSACEKLDDLNPPLGSLRARAELEISDTMCMIPPQAKYTGLENLLYRVEIHNGGVASPGVGLPTPTFKWSPVNGVVVSKVTDINPSGILTVSDTGKDRNLGFAPQEWVEVTDDLHELWRLPGTFVKLKDVDFKNNELHFDPIPNNPITKENFPLNPKVRRWDYKEGQEGALRDVKIATDNVTYTELDSGVQIQFVGPGTSSYMTDNYWLIPARTLKRDIEWPTDDNGPKALLPEGIQHHFSCLAIIKYSQVGYSFNWEKIPSDIKENGGFKRFLIQKLGFEWIDTSIPPLQVDATNDTIKISSGQNTLSITLNDELNLATSAALVFQGRTVYEFAVIREADGVLKIRPSPVELISDCRKFFHPAIDRPSPPSAATITTGIITIKQPNLPSELEVNFGPFKHGIENAEIPPAIVLGKIPDKTPDEFPEGEDRNDIPNDTREKYVSFMEDRLLYPFNIDPYDEFVQNLTPFKAIGINLKTFKINVKGVGHVPASDLVLRFWAISAGKQVPPQ